MIAYRWARAKAVTAEDRSESEYMLALCDRNRRIAKYHTRHKDTWLDVVALIDHRPFVSYYRRYHETEFARKNHCPLLKTHAGWTYSKQSLPE